MKNAPMRCRKLNAVCVCVCAWLGLGVILAQCVGERSRQRQSLCSSFCTVRCLWVSCAAAAAALGCSGSRSLLVAGLAGHTDLAYPAWLNTQHTGCFLSEACSSTDPIHTCNYTSGHTHRPVIRKVCQYCVCGVCVHTSDTDCMFFTPAAGWILCTSGS